MKDSTDITVLLDRSGSMESIAKDVVGGMASFIKEQKSAGDNATFSLVQFDSQGVDTVVDAKPIKEASEQIDFQPRGGTPLLDALGKTIVKTGERLSAIPMDDRPDKVVFVVFTDGQENESREYKKDTIRSMIERQTKDYNWQFVYLGANQDSFAEAGTLAFAGAATMDFAATAKGVASGLTSTSANIASYRHTGRSSSLNYSGKQREDSV